MKLVGGEKWVLKSGRYTQKWRTAITTEEKIGEYTCRRLPHIEPAYICWDDRGRVASFMIMNVDPEEGEAEVVLYFNNRIPKREMAELVERLIKI